MPKPGITLTTREGVYFTMQALAEWADAAADVAKDEASRASANDLLAISIAREAVPWSFFVLVGMDDPRPDDGRVASASDRPSLTVVPVGDHFDVSPEGVPSGAIDSFQLSTRADGVVASLSISGLRAEDLVTITDFTAAARRFLNGDDHFYLGDGDDRVESLGGDDEVNVGGGDNTVHAGKGDDAVSAVGAASGQNSFFGEAGDDTLYGWNGRDRLDGGTGDDWLLGYGGNDGLKGGDGADRLEGRTGADLLTGGRGDDVFKFYYLDSGAMRATRDTITDFHHGEDRIELTQFRIDGEFGDRLDFIGSGRFTESGQVRWEKVGHDVLVEVNYEGSRAADFAILVEDAASLAKADLIL